MSVLDQIAESLHLAGRYLGACAERRIIAHNPVLATPLGFIERRVRILTQGFCCSGISVTGAYANAHRYAGELRLESCPQALHALKRRILRGVPENQGKLITTNAVR